MLAYDVFNKWETLRVRSSRSSSSLSQNPPKLSLAVTDDKKKKPHHSSFLRTDFPYNVGINSLPSNAETPMPKQ
jgi:hypothetical protein